MLPIHLQYRSRKTFVAMVEDIIRAADKRKATNIKAIRISHLTEVTTFMVICQGNSRPQNQAIANAIEDDILLNFQAQPTKEGDAASGWVLLDYSSVIVHIMTPQMRNFYKLEKRWKESEDGHRLPPLAGCLQRWDIQRFRGHRILR